GICLCGTNKRSEFVRHRNFLQYYIQQLRTHSFPDMVMPYYLSEYPHQILPLPQAVEELKQKGKKKGKAVRLLLV
ncbi:MAG: hypothetical protein OSJ56_14825, partial [Prevotella sp.]|nr:hypothetical protein [Prevotella sp.]